MLYAIGVRVVILLLLLLTGNTNPAVVALLEWASSMVDLLEDIESCCREASSNDPQFESVGCFSFYSYTRIHISCRRNVFPAYVSKFITDRNPNGLVAQYQALEKTRLAIEKNHQAGMSIVSGIVEILTFVLVQYCDVLVSYTCVLRLNVSFIIFQRVNCRE